MKLLLVYTNPIGKFDDTPDKFYRKKNLVSVLAKVQIDNSIDLGWSRKNILLFTDFDYEYNGVEATVVSGDLRCRDKTSNKIPVITHLLNEGVLRNELYWYHDFDVFQNHVITEEELELGNCDLGLVTYGYKRSWNCGSFFFKDGAKDIFNLLNRTMERANLGRRCDEKVLIGLTEDGTIDKRRYKELDSTYNFMYKYTYITYPNTRKPLKVLHFHPWDLVDGSYGKWQDCTCLDVFMYNRNLTKKPFMTERLIGIFNKHDIR
jgi:hypothetical protein